MRQEILHDEPQRRLSLLLRMGVVLHEADVHELCFRSALAVVGPIESAAQNRIALPNLAGLCWRYLAQTQGFQHETLAIVRPALAHVHSPALPFHFGKTLVRHAKVSADSVHSVTSVPRRHPPAPSSCGAP